MCLTKQEKANDRNLTKETLIQIDCQKNVGDPFSYLICIFQVLLAFDEIIEASGIWFSKYFQLFPLEVSTFPFLDMFILYIPLIFIGINSKYIQIHLFFQNNIYYEIEGIYY